MKNTKNHIKIKEQNSMKINLNQLKYIPKLSQLSHKRNFKKVSFKEPNSYMTYRKERNDSDLINQNEENMEISHKKISKNHYMIPKLTIETEPNKEINLNTLGNNNDLKIDKNKRHKILLFPKTDINGDVVFREKNNSVENNHKRIYVPKRLKNYKSNSKFSISKNRKTLDEKNSNTLCQTNRNKDYYSKLIVFDNKPNYFRKKRLSEIENINNKIINKKLKNIKIGNKSPNSKKHKSFFQIPSKNEKINIEEENINNKFSDYHEDFDNRLDNLNDYINIYSISNKTIEKDDDNNNLSEENNNSLEEDKIIIKKNNNHIRNKNLFIDTNKINSLKSRTEKGDDKNTININKNIIINKKIILLPEEKNPYSKTSYGFFNTYTSKYKNIINMPYSSNTENNMNRNFTYHQNLTNLLHSRTKPVLNNFVYRKKSFVSPSPKIPRFINYCTENLYSQSNKNLKTSRNNQTVEEFRMSNTAKDFYEPKKAHFYDNIGNLSIRNYNNNNLRKTKTEINSINDKNFIKTIVPTKGRMDNKILYKLNTSNQNFKGNFNNININPNIYTINEINENEENTKTKTKILSLLEISKLLEIKLKNILNKLAKYQNCEKECNEYINFYFDNNVYNEKILLFKNSKNREILTNNIKMEIIYLFLCYDIVCSKKFNKACIILKTILALLYENLILLFMLLINNCKNEDKEIVKNLNLIVNEHISRSNSNNGLKKINVNENKIIEVIENNTKEAINYYKMLIDSLYKKYYNENDDLVKFPECNKNINKEMHFLNKIKNVKCSFFNEIYKKLENVDFVELKCFFYIFLNKNEKKEKISKIPKTQRYSKPKKEKIKKLGEKEISFQQNFILPPIKNNYNYTLILNLDETLIYFNKRFPSQLGGNKLILRPNIKEFLHEMKNLFELIIFSDTSQDYIEAIIDVIEQEEKYFSYVLSNKYITFDNKGERIKDLFLLGRKIKNVIVVDNTENLYKLNKENLICIRPFFGDVNKDKNTLKILGNFLKELKSDSEKTGDIRISLNKLKYSIYPKIINSLN